MTEKINWEKFAYGMPAKDVLEPGARLLVIENFNGNAHCEWITRVITDPEEIARIICCAEGGGFRCSIPV